jgi:hypothetical protein
MHFFAQLSSYNLESSLHVMKLLALLMLKQADGAKKETHPEMMSSIDKQVHPFYTSSMK